MKSQNQILKNYKMATFKYPMANFVIDSQSQKIARVLEERLKFEMIKNEVINFGGNYDN